MLICNKSSQIFQYWILHVKLKNPNNISQNTRRQIILKLFFFFPAVCSNTKSYDPYPMFFSVILIETYSASGFYARWKHTALFTMTDCVKQNHRGNLNRCNRRQNWWNILRIPPVSSFKRHMQVVLIYDIYLSWQLLASVRQLGSALLCRAIQIGWNAVGKQVHFPLDNGSPQKVERGFSPSPADN